MDVVFLQLQYPWSDEVILVRWYSSSSALAIARTLGDLSYSIMVGSSSWILSKKSRNQFWTIVFTFRKALWIFGIVNSQIYWSCVFLLVWTQEIPENMKMPIKIKIYEFFIFRLIAYKRLKNALFFLPAGLCAVGIQVRNSFSFVDTLIIRFTHEIYFIVVWFSFNAPWVGLCHKSLPLVYATTAWICCRCTSVH